MGYAEGDHRPGSLHHQDQDHRSPREKVLRMDRWLHPGLPLHLPADVDLQAGVRRVRPLHCPQKVLLIFLARKIWREKEKDAQKIREIFFVLFCHAQDIFIQIFTWCSTQYIIYSKYIAMLTI